MRRKTQSNRRKTNTKKRKPAPKKRGRVSKKIKKTRKKKPKKLRFKKRKNKAIYDFKLKPRARDEDELYDEIDAIDFESIRDENIFVKITFVERHKKNIQSFTHLDEYDYKDQQDLNRQLKKTCLEMNYTFHRIPARKSQEYWKRMYRMRNYLSQIIIDLETSD